MARTHLSPPSDISDPGFRRDMLWWSFQTKREMQELVVATEDMIAATKDMIAEADRILNWHSPDHC